MIIISISRSAHNPNAFYVNQGILTETTKDIILHPTLTLKDYLARPARAAFKGWLRQGHRDRTKINVTITDFVDGEQCDYVRLVIGLNLQN